MRILTKGDCDEVSECHGSLRAAPRRPSSSPVREVRALQQGPSPGLMIVRGRALNFGSSLEQDLLTALDFDDCVQSVEEAPAPIPYFDGQQALGHAPAYLVRYLDLGGWCAEDGCHILLGPITAWCFKPMLCEVRYRSDLKARLDQLKPAFRAARRYARRQGWRYRILSEVEIRTEFLENARFLRAYRSLPADSEKIKVLLRTLRELRHTTPNALLACIYQEPLHRAIILPQLWRLVAHRLVGCDLGRRLTMASEIWRREQ